MEIKYTPYNLELMDLQIESIKRLSAFNEFAFRADARKWLEEREEQRLRDLDAVNS